MSTRLYAATIAICNPNHTWREDTITVSLDDDCGYGHTAGEIWEAADDLFRTTNPLSGAHIALINYEGLGMEDEE